jgi:hypothetical protein
MPRQDRSSNVEKHDQLGRRGFTPELDGLFLIALLLPGSPAAPLVPTQVGLPPFWIGKPMTNSNDGGQTVVEPDNVQPQPPQGRGDHPTLTSDTARQGPAGGRVLLVLGTSVVGAAVVLALIYALGFAGS